MTDTSENRARRAELDSLKAGLRDIHGSDTTGLAEAALAIAALDRPRVPLDRYHAHLEQLVSDVAELAAIDGGPEAPLSARIAALNGVIAGKFGYEGDSLNYDDLQNANLMRVIDRRRGLPIALAILYMHAARGQGWSIEGLNFPGHFLLRLDAFGERAIIDPFDAGAERSVVELRDLLKSIEGPSAELRQSCFTTASNLDILLRLQNNIKLRLIRGHRLEHAVACVESMLVLAPDRPELWREAGMLYAHLGRRDSAISALETYLRRDAGASSRHQAAALLQELKNAEP